MDEPRKHAKYQKPDTKGHIRTDFNYKKPPEEVKSIKTGNNFEVARSSRYGDKE